MTVGVPQPSLLGRLEPTGLGLDAGESRHNIVGVGHGGRG